MRGIFYTWVGLFPVNVLFLIINALLQIKAVYAGKKGNPFEKVDPAIACSLLH